MKFLRVLEISWLIIFIGCLLATLYSMIADFGQPLILGAISAVSLLMFFLRRKQRKSWEKNV